MESDLGPFLRARRKQVQPLPGTVETYPVRRRVTGLRREEVAQGAGISVSYYTALEQGRTANVSVEVLDAIARALRLDERDRQHLDHLIAAPHRRRTGAVVFASTDPARIAPGLRTLVDAMAGVPALVTDRYDDVVGWNRVGAAFFAPSIAYDALAEGTAPNLARALFTDPFTREFFDDWHAHALLVARGLQLKAAAYPEDRRLRDLIAELRATNEEFESMWGRDELVAAVPGEETINHPRIGTVTVTLQVFTHATRPDHTLTMAVTEPGSRSEVRLRELAGSLEP